MKKSIILAIGLIVILILFTTFLLALTTSNSSNYLLISYPNIFSHTKAICDSGNFCQDYEILCENNKMVKINPITGASVQFSPNWKDQRDEKSIKNIC